MSRLKLTNLLHNRHEYFHLGFGFLSFLLVSRLIPPGSNLLLLIIAIVGSFLPDIDHLFCIYLYGRSSDYGQSLRKLINKGRLILAISYIRDHHKDNYFILSHNFLSPIISFGFCGYFMAVHSPYLAALFLAFGFHYILDISEDIIALGSLNPNWYLKFQKN